MKKVILLFIIGLSVFVTLKATTFGWNLFAPSINAKAQDAKLAERLKIYVRKLSEEIGDRSVFRYAKLEQAAEYIKNQLVSYGYNVQLQQYLIEGKNTKNIIVTKIGIKAPKEIIIVGAHYDSCFNPGVDYNASAVAGLAVHY